MMFAPKAVISRPGRTSLAKPCQSVGSSSIDLAEYACPSLIEVFSSSPDVCMNDTPFGCGDRRRIAAAVEEKQEPRRTDRGRSDTRHEQCDARAECADGDAAEHQRAELG